MLKTGSIKLPAVALALMLCAGGTWYSFEGGYWNGFIFGAVIAEGSNRANWFASLLGMILGSVFAAAFMAFAVFILFKNRSRFRAVWPPSSRLPSTGENTEES
jgi:hypothetical protein